MMSAAAPARIPPSGRQCGEGLLRPQLQGRGGTALPPIRTTTSIAARLRVTVCQSRSVAAGSSQNQAGSNGRIA